MYVLILYSFFSSFCPAYSDDFRQFESSVEASSIQSFQIVLHKFATIINDLNSIQSQITEIQSTSETISSLISSTEQDITPFLTEFENIHSQIEKSKQLAEDAKAAFLKQSTPNVDHKSSMDTGS